MILNISENNTNVIERGVYYYGLLNYPNIMIADLHNIISFIKYEKSYDRQTFIECQDDSILKVINDAILHPNTIENIATQDNDVFVYHATNAAATQKILSLGKLLSAEKVYGKTGEILSYERRDSLWNDPPDFFKYIMFCWGDNLTGDYVVLSENPVSGDDLLKGNFNAGVRFYFKYDSLLRHPDYILDGYHAIKVKDEIVLVDYLYACIVPEQYKTNIDGCILPELSTKIHYLSQRGLSISDWNDKVCRYLNKLS